MSYDDFSPSDDVEEDVFYCTEKHIPILPVRFSQLPYDLDKVKKPKSIDDLGSYIIRTIRQGYVYIFVEAPEETDGSSSGDGIWHVFRYATSGNDLNSCLEPADTDTYTRNPYSFTKYEWTQHYGEGKWKYGKLSRPYCWLPKSASKIWIAYSEHKWPPSFFRKGHQEAFRKQIMQPVNLRGENKWAAKADRIPELVEEYKSDPVCKDTMGPVNDSLHYRLQLSQTGFERIKNPANLTGGDNKCVALVALFDPVGDLLEMHYRLAQLEWQQKNFNAEHIYPLSMGKFCLAIKDTLPTRDEWYNMNKHALREGWLTEYKKLDDHSKEMANASKFIVTAIKRHVCDEGNWMYGKHADLAAVEGEKGDVAAAEYLALLGNCVAEALNFNAYGSAALRQGLGDNVKSPGPSLYKMLNTVRKIWSGMRRKIYEKLRKGQYAFRMFFKAISSDLAWTLSIGKQNIASWDDAITAAAKTNDKIRQPKIALAQMDLDDAVKFLTGHAGDYKPISVDATILAADDAGKVYTKEDLKRLKKAGQKMPQSAAMRVKQSISAGPKANIPIIQTETHIQFVGGVTADKKIAYGEKAYGFFGLCMSVWALYNTIQAQQKENPHFKKGDVASFFQSKTYKLFSVTIWVIDATYSMIDVVRSTPHSKRTISGKLLQTLYDDAFVNIGKKFNKINALKMNNHIFATRGSVGRFLGKFLGPTSVIVGSIGSIGTIAHGIEREDNVDIVSGIGMLIGGLMFLPGFGWAIALVGAIIIGFSYWISSMRYNEIEDVIRTSFWGSYSEYWDLTQRPSMNKQIDIAKKFDGNVTADQKVRRSRGRLETISKTTGKVSDYFAEEMEQFGELTWAPVIEPLGKGTNSVMITTPALENGEVGLVSVEVEHFSVSVVPMPLTYGGVHTVDIGKDVKNITKEFIKDSVSMIVRFTPINDNRSIRITAKLVGKKTGVPFETVKILRL
ncbi:toxin VasX [Parasulfitobacter algicola]|uniref:Toxin VasX N-terminal region domain-containing protein n=1 Tax=Parasulfitobacter algicola TaxID=2614809 RepID=A0ABX2IWN0_9RHOB|nr:toxin VasX [Sulfitobacter algicola]NSX57015.1 hypothetical protein [Sulfitobacter algicola]